MSEVADLKRWIDQRLNESEARSKEAHGAIGQRIEGLAGKIGEMREVVEDQGRVMEGVRDELTAFRGEFNDFRDRTEP